MSTLFIDIETKSEVSLADSGTFKYAEGKDFDILLFGYAYDDDPVEVIDLTKTELPQNIIADLQSEHVTKVAHNSFFERTCLSRYIGMHLSPTSWQDSMIMASACGLPASLDGVGEALGFSEEEAKMKEGKALVRYFCIPCKPTKANGGRTWNLEEHAPEDWKTFIEYNRRDVETERTIYRRLQKWMPDYSEHRLWCLDQQINDRGIKLDIQLATNAIAMGNEFREGLLAEAKDISGLENPNSTAQVKAWLEEQEDKEFVSLNKKAIVDVVQSLTKEDTKKLMELRSQFSKSSTKKYDAVLRYSCEDEHAHGCFQFYGAATGRWAGRGIQLQNLPQNHLDDLDFCRDLVREGDMETLQFFHPDVQSVLSQLIRTTFIPEDGHKFIVADFSAIEARVIAWIAGEDWRLDVFRNGGDIYCASASQAFKVPVEKHGQNAHLRQKGKIMELALGYGGGVGSMKAFGADKLGMTEEEIVAAVDKWRTSSPHVVALWKSLEQAAKKCIMKKYSTMSAVGHIRFDYEDDVMFMNLPSGRRIAYWGASIGKNKFGNESIVYMSKNQTTRKWEQAESYGGKLTENCVAQGTLVLTSKGFKPIERVIDTDLLWDGVEWAHHEGLIDKGIQETIQVNGIWLTPEHKILTTDGWSRAYEAEGLNWAEVQLPHSIRESGEQQTREGSMAMQMRLREHDNSGSFRHAEKEVSNEVLRMYAPKANIGIETDSFNVQPSCVCCVALDEAEMRRANTQGLSELRRSWNNCLRKMGAQLREFLGRHGSNISEWLAIRQNRQQQRLLSRKLQMDNGENKSEKQENESTYRYGVRESNSGRVFRVDRDRCYDPAISSRPRSSDRVVISKTKCEEQVYDIRNCGERHRFCVYDEEYGCLRIVSNCVQATARDALKESMLRLQEEGFDIRGHVHDEVIITEPIDGRGYKEVCEIMGRPISWAEGLPLRADGYECSSYRKD